tara:strand:+ start:8221 stop:8922 length:702 start_codon:yes stop_codon:yes gene_type:complete
MNFIEQCVSSVLDQDYEDFEIHAYDNESTDGTYEYLLQLQVEHSKVTVQQLPNIHPNSYREAFDAGFENSNGQYLTFVSTDDFLAPDYISNCMRIFKHDPKKIKCIQSGITGVRDNLESGNQIHYYKSMNDFKQQCMLRSPVNTPTVVYNTDLYSLIQDSREYHQDNNVLDVGVGDYDMWCGLAERNIFIYPVKRCLGYYYRWHPGQCTWQVHNYAENYDNLIKDYWRKKWNL